MLKVFVIRQVEATVVTIDPIIPLLLGLLIGLLLSVIAGSVGNIRPSLHRLNWLTTHERIMGGLLIIAVFTLGVFITYVLLR